MKILIVEDDPDAREFFSQAAQSRGYTDIDTASSGEEALAKVVRTPYDLITLDIRLPGASGLEVLSVIRNMYPHMVIAIVSAHLSEDITSETAGCADLMLGKPVHLEKFHRLLDCVAQICEALENLAKLPDATLPSK